MYEIPMLCADDDESWAAMSDDEQIEESPVTTSFPTRSTSCLPLPSRTPIRMFHYPERHKSEVRLATASQEDLNSAQPKTDRIGAYFGYNGIDAQVPRAAYDALLQRVASLEANLGSTNLERNSLQKETDQLRSNVAHLRHSAERQKEQERRLQMWEETLNAREIELTAREDALESVIRQQVTVIKRKPAERRTNVERENERHFLPRLPARSEGMATRSQSSLNF